MKFIHGPGQNVAIELSVEESELLANMLGNEVAKTLGFLSNGGDFEAEYFGTHYTILQALTFMREILIHLPPTVTVTEGINDIDRITIGIDDEDGRLVGDPTP